MLALVSLFLLDEDSLIRHEQESISGRLQRYCRARYIRPSYNASLGLSDFSDRYWSQTFELRLDPRIHLFLKYNLWLMFSMDCPHQRQLWCSLQFNRWSLSWSEAKSWSGTRSGKIYQVSVEKVIHCDGYSCYNLSTWCASSGCR